MTSHAKIHEIKSTLSSYKGLLREATIYISCFGQVECCLYYISVPQGFDISIALISVSETLSESDSEIYMQLTLGTVCSFR